ncbi:MAG: AAA family ATPase [Hyphomicrobiales bacterium]|nr:MAG: AAA family ATPase [Hyphomicrobiales bacterium]
MPFITLEHVAEALDYFAENTHPALLSVLAMARHGVPSSSDPDEAVKFGSAVELQLLNDFFRPIGGPEARPYFFVFGTGYGYSHWRDRNYPGRTLQVQRDKNPIFQKHPTDNRRWTLAPNLTSGIADTPAEDVVGKVPISVAHLAAWFYRDQEVASWKDAVNRFVHEFHLADYGLIPDIFTTAPVRSLATVPLAQDPIDAGELLMLLQRLEPEQPEERVEIETSEAAPTSGPMALVHVPVAPPGDWSMDLEGLGDLCGLRGLQEPATRALAALAAGMHVIFTGPPGCGKTQLAACICQKAGFPAWMVPATDQWTTFETIGGYFPTPSADGSGDRLDFLPGAVVHSIEKSQCLIIDEINRADIDKAFGELFTLLSGNSVTLPYRRRSAEGEFRRVRLQVGSAIIEDQDADVVMVPDWWRIIGAMNDADKASLKRLSMAFVRRFAFVPIDLPTPSIYEEMIRSTCSQSSFNADQLADTLVRLFATVDDGLPLVGLPLGPAFPFSIVRHAESEVRLDASRSLEAVLASALELYVIPQFQGRSDLHEAAVALFSDLLPIEGEALARHLAVWTGYVEG